MSRKLAAASLLILLAGAARAQEVGFPVQFQGAAGPLFETLSERAPDGDVVYDSGRSAKVRQTWDTILFHGVGAQPDTVFQAQRETPSGWTDWSVAEVSRRGKTSRFWGKVAFDFAGPGAVRVRAVVPRGSGVRVKVLGVEVFDSKDRERTGMEEAPAVPAVPPINVIGRAAWGAKPPKEPYEPLGAPVKITLHHTDGLQTSALAASEEEVRFIQDFHQNGRGWSDIGYHFLVDAAGNVFEGRPENVLGAHTLGNNPGNIGIALLGTYHPPKNDQLTKEEQAAVVAVGRYLVAKYHIDPNSLKGHRDYKETDCPGDVAYAKIPELRKLFGEKPVVVERSALPLGKKVLLPWAPKFDGRLP